MPDYTASDPSEPAEPNPSEPDPSDAPSEFNPPDAPSEFDNDLTLQIRNVSAEPQPDSDSVDLTLHTSRGELRALLDVAEGESGAVVYCDGAMSGPHEVLGPGDKVFQTLARALVPRGVTSLRLFYRYAGEFEEAVLDVLAACSFLKGVGADRVALVGHSFGGAVVIKAGQLAPLVTGVAALSSQLFGTHQVEQLGKPLLLVHGSDDAVLSVQSSEDIHRRALDPKRLVIVDGAGHALREGARQLYDELEPFLLQLVGPVGTGVAPGQPPPG